jgi:hypothetical protein
LRYGVDVPWSFETLNSIVDAEIEGLTVDIRARLARYASLIEAGGLQALPPAVTKHLKGRLWELRLTGRDGICARYLCDCIRDARRYREGFCEKDAKKDAKDADQRDRVGAEALCRGEMR